jgi:hypothetical protein
MVAHDAYALEHGKYLKHYWHQTGPLPSLDPTVEHRRPTKSQLMQSWESPETNLPRITVKIQPKSNRVPVNALTRMRAELLESREEEDETLKPTPYAFTRIWALITLVGSRMRDDFPYGYVMDDGDNGLRIEWEHNSRHVRIVIPSDRQRRHYIYYQEGEMRGADDVTINTLTGWLYWLTQG